MMIKSCVLSVFLSGAHQADTLAQSIGERVQDVHGWVEPLR